MFVVSEKKECFVDVYARRSKLRPNSSSLISQKSVDEYLLSLPTSTHATNDDFYFVLISMDPRDRRSDDPLTPLSGECLGLPGVFRNRRLLAAGRYDNGQSRTPHTATPNRSSEKNWELFSRSGQGP